MSGKSHATSTSSLSATKGDFENRREFRYVGQSKLSDGTSFIKFGRVLSEIIEQKCSDFEILLRIAPKTENSASARVT